MDGYLNEVPVSFKLFFWYSAPLDLESFVCVQVHVLILISVIEVCVVVVLIWIMFSIAWLSGVVLLVILFNYGFGYLLTSKFVALCILDVDEDLLFVYFSLVLELYVFDPRVFLEVGRGVIISQVQAGSICHCFGF